LAIDDDGLWPMDAPQVPAPVWVQVSILKGKICLCCWKLERVATVHMASYPQSSILDAEIDGHRYDTQCSDFVGEDGLHVLGALEC
jgi:hypothetical protein